MRALWRASLPERNGRPHMEIPARARDALIVLSSKLTRAAAEFFPLFDGEGDAELRATLDGLRANVIHCAQLADELAGTGDDT